MDPVGRSKEGTWVYVGLADRSPGYRLLDLRTGTILETADAKIDKDTTSRRDASTGLLKPLAPAVWGDKATGEIADEVRSAFDGSNTHRLDLLEAAPLSAEEPAEEPLELPALDDNEADDDEALAAELGPDDETLPSCSTKSIARARSPGRSTSGTRRLRPSVSSTTSAARARTFTGTT